jgi:hypothetical protein
MHNIYLPFRIPCNGENLVFDIAVVIVAEPGCA